MKLFIMIFTFCFYSIAQAGSATGEIASVFIANGSDVVLFTLTSTISDTPRCNEVGRFSIDLGKPGGPAAYTAVLEAKKQDYEVTVNGLNTCAGGWKSEDIKNILLH